MTNYIKRWEKIAVGIVDSIDGFYDKICLHKVKLCLVLASKILAFDQKLFRKMIVMATEILELEERRSHEVVSNMS